MNLDFYLEILSIESTSGSERRLAEFLAESLKTERNETELMEVGDGTLNLLVTWGKPRVLFCTHLDTVPPYIAPSVYDADEGEREFRGRGTCDAKGQLFAMWSACEELERRGESGFGLLLLAGEETGSFGAKAFRNTDKGAEYVIVGEPTDNCMVSASKGTKSFLVTLKGVPFHSGYPENGKSAVESFVDFVEELRNTSFPQDDLLGPTTWNIGKLVSDNPQNILSPEVSFRLYFRTTFASDEFVKALIPEMASRYEGMEYQAFGGDTPMRYTTFDGFPSKTVAFGSDAPQLWNCDKKILCGAGSILVAHRPDEHILLSELETACGNYVRMFELIK